MARKRRGLRPDEAALWEDVARSATPLHPARKAPIAKAAAMAKPKQMPAPSATAIPPFAIGAKAKPTARGHDLAPTLADSLRTDAPKMDKRHYQRMTKGRLAPEGRIDLHGMTLAQAHGALNGFIFRSYAQGRRLVLVITGKGKARDDSGPIPVRHGVLRHQVPHWLQTPPLSPMILDVAQAHLKHGGQGALYVYLRRSGG